MQHEPNVGFNTITFIRLIFFHVSASSHPEPRSMKWETNGELAHRDLSELVSRLLDVESSNHSNELSRLGTKCEDKE